MADGLRKDNNMQDGSSRCHLVTRLVMTAEVHALVHTLDHWFDILETLEELMRRRIETEAFVDSRTLFNSIVKNRTTAGRRLKIDV